MQNTAQNLTSPISPKVLLIESDKAFCDLFRSCIDDIGKIDLGEAHNLDEIESLFNADNIRAVLLDADIEGESGYKLARKIIHRIPQVKLFILLHDHSNQQIPTFIDSGASNIYPLSLGASKIARIIEDSLSENKSANETGPKHYSQFIGKSAVHIKLMEQISRMKDSSAGVLITGESGTGKELVARALFEASSIRSSGRFEAINCGAIPETLLESELFGHKRGAFTDAKSEKKGLFELCTDGVLFLDEIGDMPMPLQVKILRAIQEREVRPLGATTSVKVNTRIIAATNRNLLAEVESGHFRKDLYYRLAILKIHIPALRERAEDIPLLVDFFIEKYSRENEKTIHPLTASQLARMKIADWPGNIRELQNAIERAVVLSVNDTIDLDDIFEDSYRNNLSAESLNAEQTPTFPLCFADAKEAFEKSYLSNLLRSSGGNVTEAAKAAKKTRVEIYRYLSRNHIIAAEFRT